MSQPTSFVTLHRLLAALAFVTLLPVGLAGCGGSDDDGPPPKQIGTAGGVASGPDGALVTVPAGALAASAAVAVDQSDAGAPSPPAAAAAVGKVFALTPHGTTFAKPVTVRIPFDAALAAGQTPQVLKTDASRTAWAAVAGARFDGGFAEAEIDAFSWIVVIVPMTLPTIGSSPADRSVVEGDSAAFAVGASGPAPSGPLRYQWQRDGVDIPGATTSVYTLPAAALADSGASFRAVVSNNAGSVTSAAATLTVAAQLVAPTITLQPADLSVAEGSAAGFSVTATGANLAFDWQRSNDGGMSFASLGAPSAATYSLAAAAMADHDARFRVVVSNGAGSVTSTAATLAVTATPPPASIVATRLAARSVALAALANGTARSWGQHDGLGDPAAATDRTTPGPVPGVAGVVSVAAGSLHSLALTSAGEVWGWGYDGFGALGDGQGHAGLMVSAPKKIATISNVVAIAAGNEHSVFLKADGTVWTAGSNGMGQLGNGTLLDSNTVVQVPISGVVAISSTADHTLALKSDGSVWGWGLNIDCQLGDVAGATPCVNRRAPVQVAGLANVMRIAAGGSHSLALVRASPGDSFGAVWGWGSNSRGQLRTGVATAQVKTARLTWNTPASEISAGAQHSLVMHFDGTVFAFGDNTRRQLGVASFTAAFSDSERWVSTLPSFVTAICASTTNLVLVQDGSVWVWGDNTNGQVGNGTLGAAPVATPVRISGLDLS
jgi:alpha-tubulin suppressor-like RCC1 family protein